MSPMDLISIDEFKKVEIRIGEVKLAERVPDTEKLLRLSVDFGSEERQVVSGIALYFPDPAVLVGKKLAFVYNLEPRTIRGLESKGMVLAATAEDGSFSLLEANVTPGAGVR